MNIAIYLPLNYVIINVVVDKKTEYHDQFLGFHNTSNFFSNKISKIYYIRYGEVGWMLDKISMRYSEVIVGVVICLL